LPLKLYPQGKHLEAKNYEETKHPIRYLQNSKVYPYNAVVKVFSTNHNRTISITGSGVLIGKTTVLTVAHNVYQKSKLFEAK